MVYSVKYYLGEELVEFTSQNFEEVKTQAEEYGCLKIRDNVGGEYFL